MNEAKKIAGHGCNLNKAAYLCQPPRMHWVGCFKSYKPFCKNFTGQAGFMGLFGDFKPPVSG